MVESLRACGARRSLAVLELCAKLDIAGAEADEHKQQNDKCDVHEAAPLIVRAATLGAGA